uniref:Brevinin-2Rk n=1 Tax=Pelophylax ridibundus TaxID=8406 RepID=BR2K_PELRI|nr:RecName: Full=Brevinin-2Rk [Pelophylax ridibundus]
GLWKTLKDSAKSAVTNVAVTMLDKLRCKLTGGC